MITMTNTNDDSTLIILFALVIGIVLGMVFLNGINYQLLKDDWSCVEAKQITENVDKLECVAYKRKEK